MLVEERSRGEVRQDTGKMAGEEDMQVFLSSLQLADSFFPGGLYTLSHGLETFIQEGLVGPDTLQALLSDYLRYSVGPTESVALACSHRAYEGRTLALALQADRRLSAVKLPREAREASRRTGRQLLALSNQIFQDPFLSSYSDAVQHDDAPGNYAIALGLTMAALTIPRERAVVGELYAFTSNAIAAAVRLVIIDHRAAQFILHQLKSVIAEVAREYTNKDVREIGACAPLIESMAMRHEQAEMRLFMS